MAQVTLTRALRLKHASEIADMLEASLAHLWDGKSARDLEFSKGRLQKHRHICHAVRDAARELVRGQKSPAHGDYIHGIRDLVRQMIRLRLGSEYTTLTSWLYNTSAEYRARGVTSEKQQSHRKAWVQLMIEEHRNLPKR